MNFLTSENNFFIFSLTFEFFNDFVLKIIEKIMLIRDPRGGEFVPFRGKVDSNTLSTRQDRLGSQKDQF